MLLSVNTGFGGVSWTSSPVVLIEEVAPDMHGKAAAVDLGAVSCSLELYGYCLASDTGKSLVFLS